MQDLRTLTIDELDTLSRRIQHERDRRNASALALRQRTVFADLPPEDEVQAIAMSYKQVGAQHCTNCKDGRNGPDWCPTCKGVGKLPAFSRWEKYLAEKTCQQVRVAATPDHAS